MHASMQAPLANDVEHISNHLRYGSRQQRTATWQKLVSLGEAGLEGDKIARSGLVPLLVAMLEQVPSRRDPEVQNQAAALLFETAGSDAGMEVLVSMNCIPSLTTALQSGSLVKQARVCAVLGMISMFNQRLQASAHSLQLRRNAASLSSSSIPEMTRVLAEAGPSDAACTAMVLKALAAMLGAANAADQFVQAGGLEVLSLLLGRLSQQSSTFLLSTADCDSSCHLQCSADTDVWLAAVALMKKIAEMSPAGVQAMLQGPLLYLLMQCCSSSCPELQLLALTALLSLSAVPSAWPKAIKAGQVLHVASALQSPHAAVQHWALTLIKALTPILNERDECLLINAMECLMSPSQGSNSTIGESLESYSDDEDRNEAVASLDDTYDSAENSSMMPSLKQL